ncbi:target of rapamycin (TOR) kinase 1 [Trypanosoma cruzi Dm28c]|uniref:Target of rapamycin (TOR) kinase 1 n=2 Tax=Trypanosoma cruzi TaxID=5693 RepID=V5B8J9_TRYCR|nr:target of rapamycin (TOR) kinase 1 [Trypanosoma cruzi Dm28c]PWU99871.1 hypothetical protein C4B63_8g309 [Trypanosoma cruzi]
MQVWGLVGRPPFPPSSSGKAREGSRGIPAADARLLRKAGIIEDASSTITGGWIIPFSVVEEKTTGLRRRWIAWPHDKNSDDPYEANVPLLHISHYLPPVTAEAFSCLDVNSSFIVSLPRETRHLFRCRVREGTLSLAEHASGSAALPLYSPDGGAPCGVSPHSCWQPCVLLPSGVSCH